MEEWIIIEGSTEYGPCVSKFTGTKDEVKRLLMAMVDDDRNNEDGDTDDFEYGTESIDSLIAEWTAKSTDKTVKALFEADPRIIDFSFLAEELINLVEDEKLFKRGIKKGYKCLARNRMGTCVQYPNNWSIEEVRKDMEKEGLTTLYAELKDFIHII